MALIFYTYSFSRQLFLEWRRRLVFFYRQFQKLPTAFHFPGRTSALLSNSIQKFKEIFEKKQPNLIKYFLLSHFEKNNKGREVTADASEAAFLD